MFYGIYRILSLASKGNEISFISYGRPDLAYMNRLIMMRFANRKMIDVTIPKHFLAYQPFMQSQHGVEKLSRDRLAILIENE